MTVTVYRSTDASAPTLSGTAGSLLTVLDAVLVNGYGSKAAAGWSIAYTGTNKRTYTMGSGGTGSSLYIDDTGPGAGSYREARVAGFYTVTGLGAGTLQFPSTASCPISGGYVAIRKSTTADSTARAWTIVADQNRFHMFLESGDVIQTGMELAYPFFFGDIFAYGPTDVWNCLIMGRNIENSGGANYDGYGCCDFGNGGLSSGNVAVGNYMPSSWTGAGSAQWVGKYVDLASFCFGQSQLNGQASSPTASYNNCQMGIGTSAFPGNFPYPNSPDGAGWLAQVRVGQPAFFRGYVPGMYCSMHSHPYNHNDVFTATGGQYSGKTFLVQDVPVYRSSYFCNGQVLIDITGTWS